MDRNGWELISEGDDGREKTYKPGDEGKEKWRKIGTRTLKAGKETSPSKIDRRSCGKKF